MLQGKSTQNPPEHEVKEIRQFGYTEITKVLQCWYVTQDGQTDRQISRWRMQTNIMQREKKDGVMFGQTTRMNSQFSEVLETK